MRRPYVPPADDPSPSRPRRVHLGRTAAAGILATLGVGFGAAVVAVAPALGPAPAMAAGHRGTAATTTTTTTVGSGTSVTRGPHVWAARQHFMLGLAQMGTLGSGVVRGTLVVKGSDGKYDTVSVQKGTAEKVSSGEITVESADGVSQTYEVLPSTVVGPDDGGISSVKVDDNVSVMGAANGGSYTAERVIDLTQVAQNGGGGRHQPR